MAQIFNPPKECPAPKLKWDEETSIYEKKIEKFKTDLKKWIEDNVGKSKHAGKIVGFSVADGEAQYMVASIKPLKLIHLPLWDCYEFPYANRLKAQDILNSIKFDESMN